MNRSGAHLPDFYQLNWNSDAARVRWEPVFRELPILARQLEEATMHRGLRRIALVTIPHERLEQEKRRVAPHGWAIAPLHAFGGGTGYVSEPNASNAGTENVFCALGEVAVVQRALDAFAIHDTDAIGELLGYPACCRAFFERFWNQERYIDTTWPMAANTPSARRLDEREIEIVGRPETNLLLRWPGIRPVFHLPCSFDCAATIELAEKILRLAEEVGGTRLAADLREILSWPFQWSALQGVAEIETPACRIATRTDPTAERYVVRLLGAAPAAPASARNENLRPSSAPKPEWQHRENGFGSLAAMERAFRPVVATLAGMPGESVLHLACRNGALLADALRARPTLAVHGVDPDAGRIQHAREWLPDARHSFRCADPFLPEVLAQLPAVDLGVVMIGRLLELPPARARAMVDWMRDRIGTLVVYAFDDWLKKDSLSGLAASVGLELTAVSGDQHSMVGVVQMR